MCSLMSSRTSSPIRCWLLCLPRLSSSMLASPAASILCRSTYNRLGLKPCRAQKAFWHTFTSNPFSFFTLYSKLNALSSAGGLPSLFPLQVKVGLILRLCPLDFLVWCRCSKPLKYFVVRNKVLQIDFVTLWHELMVTSSRTFSCNNSMKDQVLEHSSAAQVFFACFLSTCLDFFSFFDPSESLHAP